MSYYNNYIEPTQYWLLSFFSCRDLSNNQISNINTTVFRHLPALKEL